MGARLHGGGLAAWWGTGCRKTAAEAGGPEEPQGGAHTSWAFELCSVTQTQQRFSRSCFLL